MVDRVGSNAMSSALSSYINTPLSDNQKKEAAKIISKYDAKTMTAELRQSIRKDLSKAGIRAGKDLSAIMTKAGFSAQDVPTSSLTASDALKIISNDATLALLELLSDNDGTNSSMATDGSSSILDSLSSSESSSILDIIDSKDTSDDGSTSLLDLIAKKSNGTLTDEESSGFESGMSQAFSLSVQKLKHFLQSNSTQQGNVISSDA